MYIEQFSKVSGLEINKTKSECLLLDFEQQLGDGTDKFVGIPIVEDLKIIGHYFGKNKIVCNFNNYFCLLYTSDAADE